MFLFGQDKPFRPSNFSSKKIHAWKSPSHISVDPQSYGLCNKRDPFIGTNDRFPRLPKSSWIRKLSGTSQESISTIGSIYPFQQIKKTIGLPVWYEKFYQKQQIPFRLSIPVTSWSKAIPKRKPILVLTYLKNSTFCERSIMDWKLGRKT